MSDLQRRFKQETQSVLNSKEQKIYKEKMFELLKYIDDNIILEQKNLSIDYKLFLLNKKYGSRRVKLISNLLTNHLEYINNNTAGVRILEVEDIFSKDGSVTIQTRSLVDMSHLYVTVNNKELELKRVAKNIVNKKTFLGESIGNYSIYQVKINSVTSDIEEFEVGFSTLLSNKPTPLHFNTAKRLNLKNAKGVYNTIGQWIVVKKVDKLIFIKSSLRKKTKLQIIKKYDRTRLAARIVAGRIKRKIPKK